MRKFKSLLVAAALMTSAAFAREITGMEAEIISMQDIFVFDRLGIDEAGKVRGMFRATGIRPKFAERLATGGCKLRPGLFESRVEV